MLALNAIPYPHLHNRRIQFSKLTHAQVTHAITKHAKLPGYSQLIGAARSVSRLAKAIIDAAKAVKGIPFVGPAVAAVLTAIGALVKFFGAALTAAAGVLVRIITQLT
jgi:hypothetical protein